MKFRREMGKVEMYLCIRFVIKSERRMKGELKTGWPKKKKKRKKKTSHTIQYVFVYIQEKRIDRTLSDHVIKFVHSFICFLFFSFRLIFSQILKYICFELCFLLFHRNNFKWINIHRNYKVFGDINCGQQLPHELL